MDYANRKFLHHHNGVALVETPTPGDVRPGADETKPKHTKNLADVNQHFTWPGQLDPVRLPSESAVVV